MILKYSKSLAGLRTGISMLIGLGVGKGIGIATYTILKTKYSITNAGISIFVWALIDKI